MKFFSFIYQGDIHIASGQKVIPAEDFSTLLSSAEVLEKAKQDAEQYRQEVEKECEKLKEKAKEEGFAEGLARFNEHLVSFDRSLKKVYHETQKNIIPLALKAAKKIVAKELELHPDTIVDIVIQALSPIKQNHKITIYVNKVDKETLESSKTKLKEIFEHLQALNIRERADVSPGGCIIETESGIINASIENQWRALEAAFEKYMKP